MKSTHHVESDRPPWRMTATPHAQENSEFDSVLLGMAGHNLRQPLQIIQSAHDFLRLGVRTNSELRLLRSGQSAIDRLKEQLDQFAIALRVRERGEQVKLTPVRVGLLLQLACHENEEAALRKGISIHVVPTSASILSDSLLLGAVLLNLVSNAIKHTQPGGRILLGCRHSGQSFRIDVYDTGVGIAGEEMPRIFEAFARLDSTRHDSLGIGLFIVRQAIGILGHRVDLVSTPARGSRFSILATRAE
jgi:signal transduction histidine kinase